MEEVAFEQVSEEVGGLGGRPVRRGEGMNVGGWQSEVGRLGWGWAHPAPRGCLFHFCGKDSVSNRCCPRQFCSRKITLNSLNRTIQL